MQENRRKRYKSALQAEGRWFESLNAHTKMKCLREIVNLFSFVGA
jgi:hypothetical protein